MQPDKVKKLIFTIGTLAILVMFSVDVYETLLTIANDSHWLITVIAGILTYLIMFAIWMKTLIIFWNSFKPQTIESGSVVIPFKK